MTPEGEATGMLLRREAETLRDPLALRLQDRQGHMAVRLPRQ
jgi:hypothetical protein